MRSRGQSILKRQSSTPDACHQCGVKALDAPATHLSIIRIFGSVYKFIKEAGVPEIIEIS